MKPLPGSHQLGLASPLKYSATQSGKTKNPSTKGTGLDVSHQHISKGERGDFFLDILFYRMSVIEMLRQSSVLPALGGV